MEHTGFNEIMEAYAQDAVEYAKSKGKALDFSEASIATIEEFADQIHKKRPKYFWSRWFKRDLSAEELEQICKMFGGYVGEIYRREVGGEWALNEEFDTYGVLLDGAWIFPATKVWKRVTNGPEDNLVSFYKVLSSDDWQERAMPN